MVLYKNTFPEYLQAICIGPNPKFLETNNPLASWTEFMVLVLVDTVPVPSTTRPALTTKSLLNNVAILYSGFRRPR